MKTLKQHFISDNEELVKSYYVTHLYSQGGYFVDTDGNKAGWHIQLGTEDKKKNYTEVLEDGVEHEVPTALEDVNFHAYTEEELQVLIEGKEVAE